MKDLKKESLKIYNKVKNNIIQNGYILENDKIIIGVSGGADSICLLDILYRLKDIIGFKIEVAHINHGLREVADEECRILGEKCKALEIPFNYIKVDILKISKEKRVGTEEAGREIRYSYFKELLNEKGYNKIAVAHNLNDKVETVLFNILRGSGIKGLMRNKRQV